MNTTGFDGIDVAGGDISYDPNPAAHGTISLTVQQFEDFTKEHKISWTEVPTGVEPEFRP